MGHTYLGVLPKTRAWDEVVGLIANGAQTKQVASATLTAAAEAFEKAGRDRGVIESILLLMQVPIAARGTVFATELRRYNVFVGDQPTILGLTTATNKAIDLAISARGGRTDVALMAQTAAAETVTEFLQRKLGGRLFDAPPDAVQFEMAKVATPKRFGEIGRVFFSKFMFKCLDYFLSKTLPLHIGGTQRFHNLSDANNFKEGLRTHCWEASKIVETYSGEWWSKARFHCENELSRKHVRRFTSYAMTKITRELTGEYSAHVN
jgi:hypothetical protein